MLSMEMRRRHQAWSRGFDVMPVFAMHTNPRVRRRSPYQTRSGVHSTYEIQHWCGRKVAGNLCRQAELGFEPADRGENGL